MQAKFDFDTAFYERYHNNRTNNNNNNNHNNNNNSNNNKFLGPSPRANYADQATALVPTFADRGCHVVGVTDPYSINLGFLDRSCYFFFRAAPQLYSLGSVDTVPYPLPLRKCGNAGNRNQDF
jgi:hypothetical protein